MSPDAYDIKAKLGVVFQDVAVFEELTVYENIDYFCGLYIKDKNTRKQYIEEAIELVGLEEFKKFYPKQLSGGMRQRLALARTLFMRPKIILMDEPLSALDSNTRAEMQKLILKMHEDIGNTIIMVTHSTEEAEKMCDEIIKL